jgi:DNA-binding transcriptional ArsR family regulator
MLLDQEIDLFYDLLQSDDVPTWTRIEAENRLDEFNLDVEQLDEEFVSHQTMYRHLKNCLSAEKERTIEPEKIRENFREKVGRLEQRIEMVVTEELERFSNKPWFTIGEFDVFVSVAVMCRDCSRHEDVRTLVADGGCDCDRDDRPANE